MEDVKKYKKMENVLNMINRKYIALPDDEVKRNNKIIDQVVGEITKALIRKDPLFKQMFERTFYGGSYYDGLKVGNPEEFDLDFILKLPVLIKPVLEVGDKPGFVQVHIMEFDELINQPAQFLKYDKLKNLFDDKMYLSTEKVLCWMEKIVNSALNDLGRTNSGRADFNVKLSNNENLIMHASMTKCHPAFTLKLISEDRSIKLDIDLVPCFQFRNNQWPRGRYRSNPFPVHWDKFLVVPKKPRDTTCQNINRYWRLSFQEQERALITGPDTNTLKPALRLLKKLRDQYTHSIASYHIKTVFLWQLLEVDLEKWRQPISCVFMMMLKKYADMIRNKCIPYYWNENFNMIQHHQDATLRDIGNTLTRIISNIDRYVDEDPFIVAKFLIGPEEIKKLRSEPDILGKKVLKKIASMNNSPSQQNILTPPSEKAVLTPFISASPLQFPWVSHNLADIMRYVNVRGGDGTSVTSNANTATDKGSTVINTVERSNDIQISDLGSNGAVRITNDSNVNKTSTNLDSSSSDMNTLSHSLSQMSDVSSDEIIGTCDSIDAGSSNGLLKNIVPNVIVNESSDSNVGMNNDFISSNTENALHMCKDDKSNIQKSNLINDDGFESGDTNNISSVSDDSDREIKNNIISEKTIFIALEKLNDKTDVMSNVLNRLEESHKNLLKLCSRLTEKVQILEDRIDNMNQDFDLKSESTSKDPSLCETSIKGADSHNKDYTDVRFTGNINEALEQLSKKTDNIFDTMKILQDSDEKLLTICQPIAEKVQNLEQKIDILNKNVVPETHSNLQDLLMFGARLPSSSLTHESSVLN